ncbi:hypothetical protein H4R99_006494 [Coemansia sp. RSA 1722]|nr:hypothetical protein LPJ57_009686 [Coemansia sp. RSA 486]KAJ2220187.1 protein ubiquitination [Coemansia sp. RSA 485]KAJ2592174.1 hypothetical protein H4R99_006494 [Coemansia sp. RSA 1722]KAJ2601777.1 hypothetical protein GGF39_001078 [Coemansia sp. RSA 1721]KAJ2639067.1 hypothetical protein GGF40_001173 [Coemansia sp. RSA 1286]
MRPTDIREAHPYFRAKRAALTVFVDASFNDTVLATKQRLVAMLNEHHGGDRQLQAATEHSVRLLAEVSLQQSSQDQPSASRYRVLDDAAKIGAAELVDDQTIYFVLKLANGEWEEPSFEDFDGSEMDLSHN